MSNTQKTNRTVYIDLLRILGAFFVLYNHSAIFYHYMDLNPKSLGYIFSVSASALCKLAVPLFYMISGALLLPKNESIREVYQKRVLKLLLVIGIFSTIQYIYQRMTGIDTSIGEFVKILYKSQITSSYWFLYGYLAVLISLPFLRRWAQNMNTQEFLYLFVLKILFSACFPIFEIRFSSHIHVSIAMITDNLFFMVLGYFLANRITNEMLTRKRMWMLSLACVGSLLISAFAVYFQYVTDGEFTEDYLSILTCVTATWLFCLIRYLLTKHTVNAKPAMCITYIGSCTYVIYLIGNLITDNVLPVQDWLLSHMWIGIGAILYTLFRMGIGIIIASILKLIPGLNKLI